MTTNATDPDLVSAARSGDGRAFAELVERHGGRVRSTLLRLTGDPDHADDLAQDTFLRAYRGLDGFRGDAAFGTWVLQIALHVARDGLRRSRRRQNVISLDEIRERREEGADPPAIDAWSDPSDAVSDHELADRLAAALEELPASYREVFVLRHERELSYEEIARMTEDSVGSLKVRAHRAREMLRTRVFDDGDFRPASRGREGRRT